MICLPLQLPTFRHEVMPSSQSHQVGQTPTRSHQGNDEGGPASSTTTPITVTPLLSPPPPPSIPAANSTKQKKQKKNGKHKYITKFATSSCLPSLPDPCHPTFPLLVPDWRNNFPRHPRRPTNCIAPRSAQIAPGSSSSGCEIRCSSSVWVTPPESWTLAPRNVLSCIVYSSITTIIL